MNIVLFILGLIIGNAVVRRWCNRPAPDPRYKEYLSNWHKERKEEIRDKYYQINKWD